MVLIGNSFPLSGIESGVMVCILKCVMVTLLVAQIFGDELPVIGRQQNHIGFDGAGGIDDSARADAAVVPHTTAKDK